MSDSNSEQSIINSKRSYSYRPWGKKEDSELKSLVLEELRQKTMESVDWESIAVKVNAHTNNGRSVHILRERFLEYLDPALKKREEWREEEDNMIITLQARHGNKWKTIAKELPGRNGNSVKNRYWAIINKQAHEMELSANANETTYDSPGSTSASTAVENINQIQGHRLGNQCTTPSPVAKYGSDDEAVQLWNTFHPICFAECPLEALNAYWMGSDGNSEIELAEACAYWLGVPLVNNIVQGKHRNLFEDEEYWN